MQIKLVLDTGGAPAGINREALVADIQAELDKLTKTAGTGDAKASPQPVPEGAQGDIAIVHWLVRLAADPAMAPAYARGLIYALNAILQAAKSKMPAPKKDETKSTSADAKEEKPRLSVTLPVGELVLPTTTAAIKAILDNLGAG